MSNSLRNIVSEDVPEGWLLFDIDCGVSAVIWVQHISGKSGGELVTLCNGYCKGL